VYRSIGHGVKDRENIRRIGERESRRNGDERMSDKYIFVSSPVLRVSPSPVHSLSLEFGEEKQFGVEKQIRSY
jgi:hypothetical protein